MTSGKRIQEKIGTFQVMNGLTLRELKSHTTTHQWIIYIGSEKYNELFEELVASLPVIQEWIDNEKVSKLFLLLASLSNISISGHF
jgi:hypothetical protein